MPCSCRAVSLVKVRLEPEKSEMSIVKLPVAVAGNRISEDLPRPMLIHTYNAVTLISRLQSGMVGARQGHGMVWVN